MKSDRRTFIKNTLKTAVISATFPSLISCKNSKGDDSTSNSSIESIELFRYDIDIPRYFSWGTWHNRQHLFMRISSGEHHGWSEIPASANNPDLNPAIWGEYLKSYKGLSIDEAFKQLASYQKTGAELSLKQLEFIEMGLLDLAGRVQNKPAIELLNLTGRKAVPGLFCILDNDIERIKKNAYNSIEQNLASHMKVKMFGDKELDMVILKTVREITGNDAMVISDANKGYKKWDELDDLVDILKGFHDNGLNGMEDPAILSQQQWIELQKKVGDFALIPDYPMRPAWEGIERAVAGMGKIYNLHPSCMGSFVYVGKLANKIRSFGAKIMIGDDSLVGPGCSAWQQIAIGAGAEWVEALEKKGDSDNFLKCLESSATYRNKQGYFSLNPKPGFGIEINTQKLKDICSSYVRF